VAFLIFNRPDTTVRVFEEIRRVRPSKLLVVADGPRADRPGESDKCQAVRAVIDTVDWPCEVLKNYSEVNLGCKMRVSSGLDWVFEQVEEAIILEDDCLPDQSFFPFCDELLERYRDDERVIMISGDNFQDGNWTTEESYYFSRYTHIWGWASWRRAWRNYDVEMKEWPIQKKNGLLKKVFPDSIISRYRWKRIFDSVYDGSIDTWDYQWLLACWKQGGLSCLPKSNLISNIGFGPEATHTSSTESGGVARMTVVPIVFPLRHVGNVERAILPDLFTETKIYGSNYFCLIRSIIGRVVRLSF
jgi:hypothetical protein